MHIIKIPFTYYAVSHYFLYYYMWHVIETGCLKGVCFFEFTQILAELLHFKIFGPSLFVLALL